LQMTLRRDGLVFNLKFLHYVFLLFRKELLPNYLALPPPCWS
jgi:hypothetical protein